MAIDLKIFLKLKEKFKKDQFCVGLDVGTSSLKLCKLKFSKDSVQLCDFYIASIAPGLTPALKTAAQHQEIKIVNISVCGPSTIIRYVNFPRMSQDELRKALKFEVQKYIPFSIGEVNLDAAILRQDLPDNKMFVSIAAAKKDFVSQRLKLFETGDFKINIIDIDSIALINAFNFNYPKDSTAKPRSIALLNIGATFTNLNILEDGVPLLSRDINIAGNNFTQKIADNLGVDFKTAEEIKIKPDKEKAQKITQSAESVLSGLATEIRVSFDYYESQNASSVGKIFLSGGGSLFLGLKDTLANMLGIEVDSWDPLKQLSIASNIDSASLKQASSQLAIAIGLAIRV